MTRAACLLTAAALAVAAAGCGGGNGGGALSKSAYQAKLQSLSHELAAGVQSFAAFHPTDLAAAPGFLDRVASALGGVAATLKGLRPPADVRGLHDRLVAGASSAAAELHALAARLKGASTTEARRLLAQFDPASLAGLRELQQAAAGLVAKGYRFGPG